MTVQSRSSFSIPTRIHTRRATHSLWLVIASVLALVTAACSSSDFANSAIDTTSGASFDDAGDAMDAMEEPSFESSEAMSDESLSAPEAELGSGGTGAAAAEAQLDTAALGRDIIFTADLTVGVDNVVTAGDEVARIVADNGGFLFGQQTSSQGESLSRLTFRLPPDRFQATLEQLGGIGELRTQSVTSEDVTGRVVDLQSRITTNEASLERLRALIGDADNVEVLASVERQLLERETELELLRGQLRSVRDRVDLATIHVTLTSAIPRPEILLAVTTYEGHDSGIGCPGSGRSAIERKVDATLCFEIINTGESPITDLSIEDNVLGLGTDDFIVAFGALSEELLPGQSVVFAAEVVPDRTLRLRTRVTGAPVSADGEPLAQKAVNASNNQTFSIIDNGPPSISDAFFGGWDALKTFIQLVFVFLAATIWFLWIPVALWFLVKWLSRRSAARSKEREAKLEAEIAERRATQADATPPPPTAADVPAASASAATAQAPAAVVGEAVDPGDAV